MYLSHIILNIGKKFAVHAVLLPLLFRMQKAVLCIFFLVCSVVARAQTDSDTTTQVADIPQVTAQDNAAKKLLPIPGEKTKATKQPYQPNPKKSALYAAIFPGLGQINNRQYWKLPIVYAGVGAATYFIVHNTQEYQSYRKAYVSRLSNPNYTDKYSYITSNNTQLLSYLKTNQDAYKKWLDMSYLYTGVGYILQIIDALAFAHLHNFDISQDISLRIEPVNQPNFTGYGLVIHF
jgi:hypothetical protein